MVSKLDNTLNLAFCIKHILTKLVHTKLSDSINLCNQLTMHYTGLAHTTFSGKK